MATSDDRHRAPPQPSGRFDLSTEAAPAPAAPGPLVGALFSLIVRQSGGVRVIDVAPGDEVAIGRSPDAAISLDDLSASRNHTVVARRGDALFVRDLGSRNGTLVNGRPVRNAEQAVGGGDRVTIGSLEIVVAAAASVAASDSAADSTDLGGFVVADPAMVALFETVRRFARAPSTVLVVGETGVGKEVVAEQLHRWSDRAAKPFVRLNCASLPETLLESELFGFERAAFTGADRRKIGYLEAANEGTLLLDEIGELPLAVQAKLLRVLETKTLARLGDTQERAVDVRVVCATHRDLEAEVARGTFRADLFYRVGVLRLEVPPLRERPAEIALLAERFGRAFAARVDRPPPAFGPQAMAALARYAWPGNVRELRNAVEHAVLMSDGYVELEHLPGTLRRDGTIPPRAEEAPVSAPASSEAMRGRVADIEKKSIEEALAAAGGNRTHAATKLGISRGSLAYKMAKYGIR